MERPQKRRKLDPQALREAEDDGDSEAEEMLVAGVIPRAHVTQEGVNNEVRPPPRLSPLSLCRLTRMNGCYMDHKCELLGGIR